MSKVEDQAAVWFMRMRDAEPDDPERGRFEAWVLADPAHADAYALQVALWDRFDSAADIDALAEVLERRRDAARQGRRRFIKRAAVALLVAGGGGLLYRDWRSRPLWQSALATGIGETSRQTLPDGSTLVLGADTAIRAAFSRGGRTVRLDRGAAIFEVARDAGRPFVVDGGLVRITVLGTRFAVDRFAGKTRVSVDHGRVRLATGSFWNRQTLVLEDGQVAEIDALPEGTAPPRRIDRPATDAFAFEQGTIVFDGASLGEIAETLSRYRAKPVRVGAGADTVPPFTAVAHLANLEGFLASLTKIYPVALTEEPGRTVLSVHR